MRRTNRWLGIFLTFVLIVSALCLNVWATEGSTDNSVATIDSQATGNVAKVGNTEYATIDEAIAAWTNNTTLTLLSDVTLSDVVTLNSTEHHILNLGTYTLTAASGKNAFVIKACGTGSAERSAITINADATNPGGINAGSKSIVYYKYADGGISTEDRPIIKINGGVFTGSTSSWGTAGIYTIGTAARKCATVNVAGGTFNCSIVGSGKSKLIVSGGTFNYSVSSQGDSTCSRLISGGTFKSFGFMTADSNNTKFWIGTSMGNSNVGTYIDDNGYLVVGGPVVTEPGEAFEASSPNHSNAGFGSYLTYSSAATNGIYYTSVEEALADNNKASGSVTVYVDELDMTDISYKGTIVVPEGETITIVTAAGATPTWTVTAAEGAVTYTDTEGNELVTDENGALVKPSPVKVDGVVVEITNNGNNSYDIKLGDEATFPEEGVTMTFSTTGDANGMAYVVHEHEGVNYIYVGKVADSKLSFTNTVGFSTFTVVDGGLQDAIKAAAPGGTVEILSDITVDKWIMFAEKMNIGDGTLITLNINGLTIDGNGHTLTVNSIESAGNGGYLFYDAQNLNVKDLTINIADGLVGGIGLQSGTISNVTFNGGQYGVLPGKNGVTIDGCTFNDTKGYAIYFEDARPGIVIDGNTFNTASGAYAITMRDNEQFTNNTITTGRVNLANSAKSSVSGNDFGTERFKVYNAATATISDNKINNLVFNETNAPADSTFTDDNTLSAEAQAAIDALPALAGEGTEANPYIINNLAQLKAFRDEVNAGNNYSGKYVKLNADINLNNEEWTPIGNSTNKFMGYFDGNNKTISNLKVTGNNRYVGLFGYIKGNSMSASTTPSVKDLTLTNVSVSGDYYVGGLSGQAYTCNITNVHVSGTVSGTRYVGGLVGHVYTYFEDCSFNGTATCSFDALGGIAGAGDCRAYDCSVIGTISGSNWVGGIVGNGQEGTSAVGCYVKATVSTNNNYYRGVGGIAGVAGHGYSTSEFKNNYFDGEVYLAGEKVDAIIMGIVNADDNASIGTTVEGNSWNTAYYSAETPVYVVAEISSSNASSDEWKAGASEEKSSVRNNNLVMYESDLAYVDATSADDVTILPGSSVTEEQVEQAVFDNNAVAKVGDVKYATLQEALNAAAAGTGNVTVEILNDIDLTSVVWSPVTVSAPGYPVVTVNGNNKKITGLNDMLFAGTWAGGSGLIINDLTIKDSTIVHDENDAAGNIGVGAFIGFPQASSIITLNNCHLVDSTVKGGHWTGGLIGYAAGYAGNDGPVFMNLTIKDCSVTGSVITGKGSAGGVIGHATGNAWTNVAIETTTVSGNTVTSTGSSTNKAGAVVGTIGAAGQATTVNGVEKTGGVAVSATVSGNTVKSSDATITTVYGRQGTNTGMLEIAGGSYDSNPIEENVSYAAPAEGYMIVENTDGSFGLAVDPAYGKVAMIGDTYYETLAEAITAAQAGDELILLADVDGNVTVPADIIFNGNGKQITGTLYLMGDVTFKGYTKANAFDFENVGTEINIPVGATFELTGTGRMIIGHGCTFNIEGTITDAKTADKATLTPSLIMPGASFTGAGVTFNVTNAYIKTTASYCSSSKYASDTFDFNITNSIWEQFGKLAFEAQSTAATVNFELKDSVLTTTSHLVFGVSSGEIVIDNSNVNVGTSRQIENRSTMTIKNGSVVNGAVATSSNAINPGTIIVENATYAVTGQFSGAAEGTGTLVIKKGATVSVGSIVNNANIQIDATGMAAGDEINFTANLSEFTGSVEVVNNNALEAQIVDGKIVLAEKPVAKIGETRYATLAEALEAAKGEKDIVIELVSDATLDITAWQTLAIGGDTTETITINGNGKTLTFNKLDSDWNNIATNNDAKLILNNMTITDSGKNNGPWNRYDLNFACDVELNNVKATKALAFKADATLNNVEINETGDNYAIWIQPNGQKVAIDGLTVTSAGRGIKIDQQYVDAPAKVELTVENATFTTEKKAAILVKSTAGAEITLDNVDISNVKADTVNAIWNDSDAGENYSKITVTGGTLAQEDVETFAATVGGNYYNTLEAAIKAAQDGETVTLISDIASTVQIDINKNITLDLNGKTITGTDNSTGSFGLINMAAGSELIINDTVGTGKITLTATNNRGWGGYSSVISVQRAKLTVNGGTIEHLGGTDMAYAIDVLTNTGSQKAEAVINGGVIKSTYRAIRQFANSTVAENILTVNGGTIEGGNRSIWMQNANAKNNPAELAVNANAEIKGDVLVSGSNATAWTLGLSVDATALKDGSTVVGSKIPATMVIEKANGVWGTGKAVATVAGVGYATINEAIEAAQPGETVTILAGDYATNLNVNKAITVVGETDAEGNNLVNITGKLNITADGATVKTLNVNNGSGNGGYINAKDVLVEGCTVVGGNGFRSCYTEGTVTFRDSTITGSTYGIHFDGSEGGEIVIDNCVITGWTSFARAIKKVSMTDTKFEEGNYNYVRFYQEEVVIDGCTFNENMAVDLAVSDATLTVTNSTLENGNVIDLFEGKDIVNSNITVDGTKLVRVAKIGDTYYETLAAALAAAKAGDVVDLLGNSFVDAAGFSLNGFTLANGSITFKKGARIGVHGDAVLDNVDLTFDMDGTSGYPNTAIYINGGSATSLTLKNGSDVLIKNPGYTAIYNDGTTAYALNIDNSTLTIEGKGTSTGINVANITLTNGKLTTSNTGIAINGGSVNVDGTSVVTVNGTNSHGITNVVLTVAAGGEVDVDNCAFLGLNIKDGSSIAEGATVTVDNCGTSGNYVGIPARMNGTISGYDSILVDNAKIVAQGASGNAFNSIEAALAAAKDGETITLIRDVTTTSPISITKSLTIDGGDHTLTYTGTDRAIDVPNTANGANVTIKNLNINAENANRGLNYNTTGEFTVENVVVTIGANVDGYAINFPGSADGAKVTITNCALTSRTPLNIWGENMEINVVDSEITSVDNSSTYFYSAIQLNNDGYTCANGTVVTVTGGKLTARDEEGEASFAVTNWSETGIVNISATTEVIGTVQEVVAWIGGVGFTSLQAAINSEYTGTIKILRDFAISKSVTVPAGKNVTIDLNGKTISGSSSESTSYAMLTNKGDLTIKDSVGGGKITYVYTGASSNYSFTWGNYTILNSGELTVESGTIENTTNLTGHMFSAIDNHSGGVVTINGGTISCPNYVTIRQFASSATADNTVVINGGTVSGKFALWPQNANGNADTKATLTLNGGIIEGSSKALYIGGPLADTFTITKSASLDLAAPADHKWVEQDGEYVLAACVYVAELNGTKYESLADALTAAQDGDTVTLIWADGDAPIAMNGAVYGKTVTITGTATVDWSKGFLFVGRGGAGNGTVIFENAVLTSASDNASTGIHVSGREKDTNNKYDGTLVINNSTIELDYLINKGDITLDNSTLTVKNGFSIGGRPASETESGVDATATITLNNGSKVVVNKHNGMGLGYEAIGVMNIDATSTFETTQSFLVTAKGTMNIAGKVVIAGTLTNNGQIVLTDAAATLTSSECGNVTTNVADHKVAYANGTYSVVKNENKIISYSLSLEGEIAYRVTYQLNADTLADENAKIVFSFVRDGEPVVVEIPVNNGVSKGDNKYQYSVDLYSFEMMTDITSKLVIGTTEQENCTATASIRDYAEYVLGSETSAEYTDDLKAMLKAMLNYGAYAQTYFGYNAEDLANAGYETDLSVVKATDVTNINAVSGSLDGIAIRGVSLELKARTSLRFVFTVAEGYSIDDYTFKYGDTELEVESLSDGSYRVCVENINVFELDNAYTVDVTMEGNAESTYSVTSSALSYVSIVLNGQYEDGIVNLCKALYLYNQAGNTYYGR